MSTKNLGIQFKVTNITNQEISYYMEQCVRKRIGEIRYVVNPFPSSAKLEYVGSRELSPLSNIIINDRSDELLVNTGRAEAQEIIGEKSLDELTVVNKNFIITQEFIENTNIPIPLYYKCSLSSDVIPESIRLLDKDSVEISQGRYKVVTNYEYNQDTGAETETISNYYVFNSLENKYDPETGDYDLYYLQYTTSISGTETTILTILNNELAYPAAEFGDFWYQTPGRLKPWTYAYYLADDSFVISLPKSRKYAIKYNGETRICLKPPASLSNYDPWFLRVINGSFNGRAYSFASRYSIPEFGNQAFNPVRPYKLAVRAECDRVSKRIVKLPHENIILSGVLSHSVDIIFEKDDVIQYAITSDSTKTTEAVTYVDGRTALDEDGNVITWSYSLMTGIDSLSGFVYTGFDILSTYKIYATYTYKETYYTLTSLPLNPLFSPDVAGELKVVYLVPTNPKNANSTSQNTAIQWLRVNPNGTILACSQDRTSGNLSVAYDTRIVNAHGYRTTGVIGLHYSRYASTAITGVVDVTTGVVPVASTQTFPKTGWLRAIDEDNYYKYFKYINKTATTFILSGESDEVPATGIVSGTIELVNFLDEYTIQSRRDYEDEEDYHNLLVGEYPNIFSSYFVLGEVSINPAHSINDLARIDIRENGGGIIPHKYEEAKACNPEVQWLSDFGRFDGQPYPGKSVIVVKLPVTLKNDFSLDVIKAIVQENVPLGTYPIIQFYGYKPRIVSVVPATESIVITWRKEGSDFTYDIWYCQQENGEYIQANGTALTDGVGTYNTYTITGLTTGVPYFVKVTMTDNYTV